MSRPRRSTPLPRRGQVYWIRRFPFDDGPIDKYCVIMEDYDDELQTIIVVTTTSKMEREYESTAIRVHDGVINHLLGDTLIDVSNFHEIDVSIFSSNDCRYLDTLPASIIGEIDSALAYVRCKPEKMNLLLRMKPRRWT